MRASPRDVIILLLGLSLVLVATAQDTAPEKPKNKKGKRKPGPNQYRAAGGACVITFYDWFMLFVYQTAGKKCSTLS